MLVVLGEDDGERKGGGNCVERDAGAVGRVPVMGMRKPVSD